MKAAAIPDNEEKRLSVLREYNILDSLPEKDFDDFTFLASYICQTPIALISLVDESRQWFKAKTGLQASETHRDLAFCAHAILQNDLFIIDDSLKDERFHDNPLVVGEPKVRFYAGAPLLTPNGYRIGTLCVIDHLPRTLSFEQQNALLVLARQVMNTLENRKKLRENLLASQILQSSPMAIFCKDYALGNGIFVEWNAAAESLWGLKKQEVLGRSDYDFFPQEQADFFRRKDLQVIDYNQSTYIEAELVNTPIKQVAVRTWKVPVAESNGKNRYVLGISLDITKQIELEKEVKMARELAEENAHLLDLALDDKSLGIWDWDLKIDEVKFDRRWYKMLGLNYDKPIIKIETWRKRIHLEDIKSYLEVCEESIYGLRNYYEHIYRIRHNNNGWLYVLERGRILRRDSNGVALRLVGTHTDITVFECNKSQLRETLTKLEEAEINGKFGSWELDLETMQGKWSKGHNALFGLDIKNTSHSFSQFLNSIFPEDREKCEKLLSEILNNKKDEMQIEYRIKMQDDTIRHIKCYGKVIFEKQVAKKILGTVQDITEIKLVHEKLDTSRREALAAARAKSNFLATMSHEIRTPLNGIIGNAQLLIETNLTDEQKEMLSTVKSCGESLLVIINDILDFSKIEVGKLEIEKHPFDIRRSIKDCIKTLLPRANEKLLTIDCHIADDTPEVLLSDYIRFQQVLLNLLSNAVKYTDKGEILIRVNVIEKLADKVLIQVAVKDTGVGIPLELQGKLFQEFSQIDTSTTRKYGGTGLGLAICKKICGLLGGDITAESQYGKGSKFVFTFSASLGQNLEPINKSKVITNNEFLSFGNSHPMNILVAEDNKTNQELVCKFLKKFNYNPKLVGDGKQAVTEVLSDEYDIVFMDIHMPNMDGYEATRKIRSEGSRHNQPYIVALTASVMNEDKRLCSDAGMDDFLKKPLELNELYFVLKRSILRDKNEKQIKLDDILHHFSNDAEIFLAVSKVYLSDYNNYLQNIKASIDENNMPSLEKYAHSLKGAASNFSPFWVVNKALRIEEFARKGLQSEAAEIFPRLVAEAEKLRLEIESLVLKMNKLN